MTVDVTAPEIDAAEFAKLDQGTQRLFKWQYHLASGFYTKLFELIFKADKTNRARLARGFPKEVEAANNYKTVSGWWPDLQERILGPEGRGT